MNYDFTTSANKANGNNLTRVDLLPLKYAVFSGDVNLDGTIDSGDLSQIENDATASLTGYIQSDVNGDYFVDAEGLSIVENNVTIGVSAIVP